MNVNWWLWTEASNNESCGGDETHHCTFFPYIVVWWLCQTTFHRAHTIEHRSFISLGGAFDARWWGTGTPCPIFSGIGCQKVDTSSSSWLRVGWDACFDVCSLLIWPTVHTILKVAVVLFFWMIDNLFSMLFCLWGAMLSCFRKH